MKNMKEAHRYLYRRMAVAILMIVLVAAATAISMRSVNKREEQHCWDTLHAYTALLDNDIDLMMEGDRTLLRSVAKLIADQNLIGSPELPDYLREFETDSTITRIGLLLPGDTVVFSDGQNYDVSGKLSFAEEAALGEHISNKEESVSPDLGPVLRNFVPVQEDGKTVAMLYGAAEIARLPNLFSPEYYGWDAAVYIIDGNTGDFLLDTWHQTPGNLFDPDLWDREMKQGYSYAQLQKDIQTLQSGHVAYVSETIGRYLYFYYAPSGINQWSVAVSVSEDVAFAEAIATRQLLFRLAVFECVCFVLYFLWVCFDARREAGEKQQRIDTISYLYDVEKILFVAHREKQRIDTALERICRMAGTRDAFFVIFRTGQEHQIFVHSEEESARILELLRINDCYQDYCRTSDSRKKPQEVMVIPVTDVDGNPIGALGIHGWKTMPDTSRVLDNVAPSFTLLYNNIKNFNRIKEMSERDLLTSLLNRNSFEVGLGQYAKAYTRSIAIIYADANGLHELNNSQGHAAGDRMLQFVGGKIKEQFGAGHTYRIGGDEFAAFALDTEEDEIQNRLHLIDAALTEEGYHASFGMALEKRGSSINLNALLKLAEQRMYDAKSKWYQQQGIDRRAR